MCPHHACTFCRIIAGEQPADWVYSGPSVVAFLDIRPINPGHVLVVPRIHVASFAELPGAVAGAMVGLAQRLTRAMRSSAFLESAGVTLLLAEGPAAGQEIGHAHLHVVPRRVGDGFRFRFGPHYGKPEPPEQRAAIRAELAAALGHGPAGP